jgi:ribonuclease P protein component
LQTFSKEERLHEKKIIKELFDKGLTFHSDPFKVTWLQCAFESKNPAKVLISVPARNFKKATDRNYIKRLIREAYRKNKNILYEKLQKNERKIAFMLFYSGKIIITYQELESKIVLILQRLAMENEKTAE